jgi:DNA-binding transcriptional regulator YhcF (GntR family)
LSRKAGSIVLDRLRDRILLGRYFGCWAPGDRLPSVRVVARVEAVDRKTAAAAYRRLQREGLVRIEPRSGVYLDGERRPAGDPLRRLHAQWLEKALATAGELGLDPAAVARVLQAVARVQARRIAVVDPDPEHAALLARELHVRTGLDYGACSPSQLPASEGPLLGSPFVVATPIGALRLPARADSLPVVLASLAPQLLRHLARLARRGRVTVVVGTQGIGKELERALRYRLLEDAHQVRILTAEAPGTGPEASPATAHTVVLWPGAAGDGDAWAGATRVEDLRHAPLVSPATLGRIRSQIVRTALDQLSTSSGV